MFVVEQNNQKGLIPTNGASPNFLSAQKSFIGHQYKNIRERSRYGNA
jgi:hypothetical protein